MSEYSQLKGQVSAAARKQTGSLAVRDLTGLVKQGDAVNTENLITLFTVVSKSDKPEWLKGYEVLSDFVVSPGPLYAWLHDSFLREEGCVAHHVSHGGAAKC